MTNNRLPTNYERNTPMKTLPKIRLTVQLLCISLTIVGFFTNFQVTLLIILVATIVAGTFYCGWVCPFGTVQDLFSRLGKKLGIRKRKMPRPIHKYLKYVRYIIFGLVMFISADIIFTILSYDPRGNFSMILSGTMVTTIAFIVILSFGLIALFFERPFCNYLCYEGAKYGLFSSLRFITIKRDTNSCVDCSKCDKVCPMNIEVSKTEQVDSLQCINCFECVVACPVKDTLTYGPITLNKRNKQRYGLISLIILVGIGTYLVYNMLNGESILGSDDISNSISVQAEESTMELTIAQQTLIGEAEGIVDGVYTGTAHGFKGPVTVAVTVRSQMITDIIVTDNVDDAKWFNRAEADIPDDIIDAQSTDVSAVSGATYSSYGIIDAVKDALNGDPTQ